MRYFLLALMLSLSFFGLKKAFKNKDFFNPILLFSLPILISLVINLVIYDQKYSISESAYVLYFLSVCSFCIGIFFGVRSRFLVKGKSTIGFSGSFFIKLLWVLMSISSLFAVYQIYKGYISNIYGSGLSNLINNVRYYTAYVSGNSFLAKYGIVIADFLVLYYLYLRYIKEEKTKKNLLCVLLSVLFYLIFTATEFNKTNFLYLFSILLFFFVLGNRRQLRKIFVVGLVMLALFVFALNGVSEMTGKESVEGEHWAFFYFGSEFRWLDLFAFKNDFHTGGYMSLGIIGRFLALLNVISMDGYNAYRELAMANNSPVSSFVLGPYLDFGYLGLIVLFVYGFLIGWIYFQHQRIGGFWTILYSTCIYQLVISFFAFQFGMSSQVYLVVLFVFASLVSEKKTGVTGALITEV